MSATETKVKTDADRLAEVLEGLHDDEQPDASWYAELIIERLPRMRAGNVLAMAALMVNIVAEVTDHSAGGKVIMHKAHVPVSWDEYPNGRVGLDTVGNIAEVHLDDAFEVE